MKSILFIVFLFSFQLISYSQETTKIAVIHELSYELIDAENQAGVVYVSLFDLLKSLPLSISDEDKSGTASILFGNHILKI